MKDHIKKIRNISMNIKDYYLDIDVVFALDKDKSDKIFDIYYSLLSFIREKEVDIAQTYFNTLVKAGYLKNKTTEDREEKIEKING